jgi:alpha/beta superfamily hydrolase
VAVWRHLEERGAKHLHFAGYSYGAWIGLRAMKMGLQVDTAILVSPPLDFLDFKGLAPPPGSCLITAGDQDDFCAVDSLKHWVADTAETPWPARIEILPHCDHFYWGLEDMLAIKIAAFLRRGREA